MLPSLTPDLSNDSINQELVQTNHFSVTITAGNKQFSQIASAVHAWEFEQVPVGADIYYDDDDEEEDFELEDDGEAGFLSLHHHANLAVISELHELLESVTEEGGVTVSIIYHTPKSEKPLFRHSFTGFPSCKADLQGSLSDTSPLTFTLCLDCTHWSLTTLV